MRTTPVLVLFWVSLVVVIQYVAGAAKHNGAPFPEAEGGLRASFPKGFVFGTATSAYQVEGMANKEGRGPSIWDTFVKIPGIVANNATGDVTVDQYHRYKEDIDLLANLNFDAYRFSISWSRIFPEGTGKVNWKGVAYYNRLIDYLLKRGITPYANLYHYDLPLALEKKYLGLLSDRVVKDFADFADFCFKTYGDRVKNWMTFNEPRVVAALGYDTGFFAPGRCSKAYGNCTAGNSGTEPYIAAHHLILSHAAAVQRYREKYQKTQKGKIGILLDFVWYEPLTRSKADRYAAQRARDFHVGWFIHPIVYGEYPKTIQNIVGNRLPKFTKEEVKMVKGSMDFVGINEYTAYYIYAPDKNQTKSNALGYQNDWNAGFAYEKNGVPIGPRAYSSWLYQVPWGMYKCITYIKEHYGNPPVILSENGMDNPGNQTLPKALHDTNRIHYYRSYLEQLKKAVDEGANVAYSSWLYQVPWGMYKCITYIKEHYGNPPVILSENGMDNPGNQTLPKALHDTNRIHYYRSYLEQLKKAVDEGANVVGYFAWSLLDNFEWRLGYTSRFGIVYVDFTTLKRYPKMSAYWFKKLLTKKKH